MGINYDAQIEVRDNRNGNWFWVHNHVLRDNRLTKADKIVYCVLASYSNQSQECFPSLLRIQSDAAISTRQSYLSIKHLEALGYLTIRRNRGKPNVYSLNKTTPAMIAPVQNNTGTPAKSTIGTPAKEHHEQELVKQELINKTSSELSQISKKDPNIATLIAAFESEVGKMPRPGAQAMAAAELISDHGLDRALGAVKAVAATRGERYAPSIASLEDLRDNWVKLENFFRRQGTRSKGVIRI